MLSAEEKKEKNQFFRDLDRLLDADEKEDTAAMTPQPSSKHIPENPNVQGSDPYPALTNEATDMQTSRKRKPSKEAPQPEPRAAPHSHLTRTSSLPGPKLQPEEPSKVSLARAATLPEYDSKQPKPLHPGNTFTNLSNLEARLEGKERPKLRPLKGKKWKKRADVELDKQIFRGFVFYFFPNNDDDEGTRARIHQAVKHGASWAHEFCEEVTHIIVTRHSLNVTEIAKFLPGKEIPKRPILVLDNWLWDSWNINATYLRDTRLLAYQVPGSQALNHSDNITPSNKIDDSTAFKEVESGMEAQHNPEVSGGAMNPAVDAIRVEDALEAEIRKAQADDGIQVDLDNSDDTETDDEAEIRPGRAENDPHVEKTAPNQNKGYVCMQSHDGTSKDQLANAETIEKLQEMVNMYDRIGEQWRSKAFRQAISKLRRHPELVRTKHEAREIGLGESTAAQVEEIVSTGRYARLESAKNDPRAQLIKLFTGVYGAGEATADKWIAQGYQTLDDLREKADLSKNQQIGLEHYDDFQQRIPRREVALHAAEVEKALKAADPNLQLMIGGSYRRGSESSGDIDCIIFMEDSDIVHIRTLMLDTVIPKLTDQGFLKAALAAGSSSRDDSSKWHGASALPGSKVWRRIDFLYVPWKELGAALIYFTGNDLFNRSIRLLAGNKGMRLNQHGLYGDVMRGPGRKRITDGTLVEAHDEKRIFEVLGVPYRPPKERNV